MLRLAKLQELDKQTQNIRVEGLKEGENDINGVLNFYRLPFVPKII